MFQKILVANRGEIAIRAFRAAYEVGARTVAIFPYEDRNSVHRFHADEAYQIGDVGHPVRAYLDVSEIIRVAKLAGADAIYPGYGFLSENPALARAAEDAGIRFIGPDPDVLNITGDKVLAKQRAFALGIPILQSSKPSKNLDELVGFIEDIGVPVFVKSVGGGGGRGMRRIISSLEAPSVLREAMREAKSSFGDDTMFIEKAMQSPRHIEVQILADSTGNVVHLYERDCSLQRRHQKVLEIAPAPNLEQHVREALYRDAIAFASAVGYQNAGTVEFLLDTEGEYKNQHVFIEMNPRIQVEHTVTEEITDIDLVQAQMRIASGQTLVEMGLEQKNIHIHGSALQCRITTEDPSAHFRPDTGVITVYRSPGGGGIRLDGGTIELGAQISPYFDSMLAKLTVRGRDFASAVQRARRALAEFRVRGVATNIPFLQAVAQDGEFCAGKITTSFIEERSDLLNFSPSKDRGTKMISWLADVTLNRPNGLRPVHVKPSQKLVHLNLPEQPRQGSRQRLLELGPEGFAADLRKQKALAITETTFRDAHQSLLATRIRTQDLLNAAPYVASLTPDLLSLEVWGGATYDVALRFLSEDPWQRLELLREKIPNIALQMLLRGRNTVGYTPYPNKFTRAFVFEAAQTGIDIFRIFDALNDVEQMRPAIEAVRETGTAVAQVAMCYTGDLLNPNENLYTLDYYLRLAENSIKAGAHMLAIKDMAGLLRPYAAKKLVHALRERFDVPIQVHTHDTPGGQMATLLVAAEAGADGVDVANAALAGGSSQPSMSALVAYLENTSRETNLSLEAVTSLEPYWETVRQLYAPFEGSVSAPSGLVYHHEIPGGQISNLREQARSLGVGDSFKKVQFLYAEVDKMFGRIPKVTPSSKVVGDLALYLAAIDADLDAFEQDPQNFDIPDSVVGFMAGQLGNVPGEWTEPFRSKILQGRVVPTFEQTLSEQDTKALERPGSLRRQTLNRLLFPSAYQSFLDAQETFGDLSALETLDYLYGLEPGEEHVVELSAGVRLHMELEAIGEPDHRGICTVMTKLNGQLRPVFVKDQRVSVQAVHSEKAQKTQPGHVGAPFSGVVTLLIQEGDKVAKNQQIASIEAMKMEAAIAAPVSGIIERVAILPTQQVEPSDLLVVIVPEEDLH